MKTIEELGADAEQARANFDAAALVVRSATRTLRKLERQRSNEKLAAAARIEGTANAANQNKPFTFAQACDFAQVDNEYRAYKERCDEAALELTSAEANLASAKLEAELANNLVRASVGAGL